MPPPRVAVFVSAGGPTLQNRIARSAPGRLAATTVLVVSGNADAFALERAERAGIPTTVVSRGAADAREEFSRRIFDRCRQAGAELVCLAGFLQLITIPD